MPITYTPNQWQATAVPPAGDTGADHTRMAAPYNRGLVHLITYLMHTQPGRDFMHSLIPGQSANPAGGIHDAVSVQPLLLAEYARFGVVGAAADALVGAHLAGFQWVNDVLNRAQHEVVYKQHLAAVSWFLWEEGQGPMFSLGW